MLKSLANVAVQCANALEGNGLGSTVPAMWHILSQEGFRIELGSRGSVCRRLFSFEPCTCFLSVLCPSSRELTTPEIRKAVTTSCKKAYNVKGAILNNRGIGHGMQIPLTIINNAAAK